MSRSYDWDPEKAEANLRTHGVSFEDGETVDDDTDDETRLNVGGPFEASPSSTGQAETDPLDRGDVADPPDNTLGQPSDPR